MLFPSLHSTSPHSEKAELAKSTACKRGVPLLALLGAWEGVAPPLPSQVTRVQGVLPLGCPVPFSLRLLQRPCQGK